MLSGLTKKPQVILARYSMWRGYRRLLVAVGIERLTSLMEVLEPNALYSQVQCTLTQRMSV